MYSAQPPDANENFVRIVNARLGTSWTSKDFRDLGVRILQAEKDFNRRAGLTKKDDRLPEFFYKEPLSPHNVVFPLQMKKWTAPMIF
jgi:aldehyde:ferredoxin oxidoreductase